MLTSLKLMIKVSLLLSYLITLFFSCCAIFTVNATQLFNESLQVHGFVAQGIVDANHSNFINDDENVSFELTEIGVNASYQIDDKFRVAGQVVYLNGGNRYFAGPRIDYLLLEWDAYENEAWSISFYLGRVKNNHWLHSSTRNIPFARPSIILPQVTYFDGIRDLAVGGDGAAIKLTYSNDKLGEFDFNFSRGKSIISDDQADVIIGEYALGEVDYDLDSQASIYWRPAYSQWKFGLSALNSTLNYNQSTIDNYVDAHISLQFYTMNVLYEAEKWQFSSEIVQERLAIENFYFPNFYRDETGHGYYAQASFHLTDDLSLIVKQEHFYNNKNDKNGTKLERNSRGAIPAYFGFHNDKMIGFSYDFTNNFRVNAEYHWMEGGARLSPVVQPNPIANNSKYWQVWAIQFMYWL